MNTTAIAADAASLESTRTPHRWTRHAPAALRAAATSWFGVAVLGQLLMALYVVVFYGGAALRGQPQQWNGALSRSAYVDGDAFGNLVLASHLLFAAIVMVGGVLQFVPALRRTAPALHRWNGRLYMIGVAIAAVGGTVMLWTRPGGDIGQDLGISLNALLILAFAWRAWRHARARRFDLHRRWVLRLFLAVSGGWFFRVGLMLWIVINQGPVGFDPETSTGPALTILAFAQYIVPLAALELYFHAQAQRGARGKFAMAAALAVLTLATGVGVFAAANVMWLPRI